MPEHFRVGEAEIEEQECHLDYPVHPYVVYFFSKQCLQESVDDLRDPSLDGTHVCHIGQPLDVVCKYNFNVSVSRLELGFDRALGALNPQTPSIE